MGQPGHLANQLWLEFSAYRTVDLVCPECENLVLGGRSYIYVAMDGPDAHLHVICFIELFDAHDNAHSNCVIPGFGDAHLFGGFPCAVCQKTVNQLDEAHAFMWRAHGELEVRVVHDSCAGKLSGIPSGAACAPLPYRPGVFKS